MIRIDRIMRAHCGIIFNVSNLIWSNQHIDETWSNLETCLEWIQERNCLAGDLHTRCWWPQKLKLVGWLWWSTINYRTGCLTGDTRPPSTPKMISYKPSTFLGYHHSRNEEQKSGALWKYQRRTWKLTTVNLYKYWLDNHNYAQLS